MAGRNNKPGASSKAVPSVIGKNDMIVMDATAQSIKGVLDNLRVQLHILESDIKADQKGKFDYDKLLGQLESRKADLEARVKERETWAEVYDNEIGPSMNRFGDMTSDIKVIYEKAKKGHADGIKLLEKEFGYHPAFKRPGDTFTGIPYKPI
jgi:hypothetical protein